MALRQDPTTGISVWFRDHADHHMAVLLDPDSGPFEDWGSYSLITVLSDINAWFDSVAAGSVRLETR